MGSVCVTTIFYLSIISFTPFLSIIIFIQREYYFYKIINTILFHFIFNKIKIETKSKVYKIITRTNQHYNQNYNHYNQNGIISFHRIRSHYLHYRTSQDCFQ